MTTGSYLKSKDTTFLEASWERQMQYAGMERWERNQLTKSGRKVDTSTTDIGQKYLREFHALATICVEEAQRGLISNGSRSHQKARAACIVVPAETCALLTLKVILDVVGGVDDHNLGFPYQTATKKVAKALETELNFRNWIKESKEAAKEYAKANDLEKVPKSQAERLLEESGLGRANVWKWKQRFEELNEYKWDELEKHYAGDFLLDTVLEGLEDSFETHTPWVRGRKVKHIRMTEDFRREFDKMGERISRMQVIKKPMLVRPKPWAKTIKED